jgi:glycerol-3-phosphate dehydrogenase (NAD(P)+)
MKVAVIGAGSWGTTVAAMLSSRTETVLWARRADLAERINHGANPDYLPGFDLPDALTATSDIDATVDGADVVVMGVPSHGYRTVLGQAAPGLAPETPILSLTKGIEQPTLMRMNEVTFDVLRDHDPSRIGALTGPNLAREIMA